MRSRRVHAREVGLFAGEFELLDDCLFGAMRDGELVCVKMVGPVGVGALKEGEVAMELDPPETEGVFFYSWWKVLLIRRTLLKRTVLCQQEVETIAANVDARTDCPKIAYDSARHL